VPEILRGSEPRFEDMVRYMESASEGLAHHFAVEDDELRLKTNIGVVRFRREVVIQHPREILPVGASAVITTPAPLKGWPRPQLARRA
jgi:hypothetical protein